MLNRISLLILLTIAAVSALVPWHPGAQRYPGSGISPANGQTNSNRAAPQQVRPPLLLGKIGPPADLSMELVMPEDQSSSFMITVHAVSQVPVGEGVLSLQSPPVSARPGDKYVLWSGKPSEFVDHTAEFVLDPLPSGRYKFVAVFEFAPDLPGAGKIAISKSLFIDVRPGRVLSSNVSFKHIERNELKSELEQRAMRILKPGLASAGAETIAREIELMESTNPGVIAGKVAELRATDPEVARRIMELNRIEPQIYGPAVPVSRKYTD